MARSASVAWRGRSRLRRTLATVVAATVVAAPALAVAPHAAADDVATAQAEAQVLARRLDDQGRQVEILAEQYDGARVHADQLDAQVAAASQRLDQLAAGEQATHATLVQEAVAAYVHGGYGRQPTATSLAAANDLAVERDYFQLATGAQSQTIDRLHQAQAALRAQKVVLVADQQSAAAAVSALDGRRRAVEQADAATRATLAQVQGQLVQLVAQQQAALDAARQAQERSQLASVAGGSSTNGSSTNGSSTTGPTTGAATGGAAAGPSRATTAPVTAAAPRAPTTIPSTTRAPASTAAPSTAQLVVTVPTTPARTTTPTTSRPTPAPPVSARVGRALAYAQAQLGKQYEWGAAGPDTFDCSGLTMRAWEAAGISLPHYAAAQYAETAHIPIANLEPGDLVFFGTDLHHVGIYIGGGQMIDAPHTGAVVQVDSIYWPDLQPFGGRPA